MATNNGALLQLEQAVVAVLLEQSARKELRAEDVV